jgi:hypothetical protein
LEHGPVTAAPAIVATNNMQPVITAFTKELFVNFTFQPHSTEYTDRQKPSASFRQVPVSRHPVFKRKQKKERLFFKDQQTHSLRSFIINYANQEQVLSLSGSSNDNHLTLYFANHWPLKALPQKVHSYN